jgi:hypothetical protein
MAEPSKTTEHAYQRPVHDLYCRRGTKFILAHLNYAIFMVYLMTMPVIQDYAGRVIPINLLFYGVRSSQYRSTSAA